MSNGVPNQHSGLTDPQALDHFVVDNDELLQLEERIGRFNIFDALGIVRTEIRHSNFLAWLLDPAESHGQGPLFLKAVLMDLLKRAGEEGLSRALSPVQLDGAGLHGVEVRREWRSIDLLITCKDPAFVVAVENKVGSKEHSNQLERYRKTVTEEFGDVRSQFVFLTRDGDEPTDDDWTIYTYEDIHRVLLRVRNANATSIGDDVLAFLDHYIRLIGSRFMDDPKIDELCQTIYKNHRQALDLIMERVGSPQAQAVEVAAELIKEDPKWRYLGQTQRLVHTWPVEWEGVLPQVGTSKTLPSEQWMFLQVYLGKKRCRTFLRIGPLSDPGLRRQIIARLAKDLKEFGLKALFKSLDKLGPRWATLGTQRVCEWRDGEIVDTEDLTRALQEALDRRHPKLATIPDALRPIIAEWEARRMGGV